MKTPYKAHQVHIGKSEIEALNAMIGKDEMAWIEVNECGMGQTFVVQRMANDHGWKPKGDPVNITDFDSW